LSIPVFRAWSPPAFPRPTQKLSTCAMSVFAEVLQYRPFRRVFPPAGAGRIFPVILTGPVRNAVAPPSSRCPLRFRPLPRAPRQAHF
jgi:hypothetical protein